MQFEIKDGLGLIRICENPNAIYFQYSKPITVVWNDNMGSIGQFLTISEENESYRNFVDTNLSKSVYRDFSNNIEEAYIFVKPLLSLLQNGKYNLLFSTSENKNFFRWKPELDPDTWDLIILNATSKKKENEINARYQNDDFGKIFPESVFPLRLLEHTTYGFYPIGFNLLATQPKESISSVQIDFYKQEISSGKRPFAIVISKNRHTHFVIDGHHKLIAYHELDIYPQILSIEMLSGNHEIEFDKEAVQSIVYTWQYNHIMNP